MLTNPRTSDGPTPTQIRKLDWSPVPQDDSLATFLGKRDPGDGLINWHESAREVDASFARQLRPIPVHTFTVRASASEFYVLAV